jgi:hypothetical protein
VSGEGLEVRVGLELCHFVPGVVGRSSWAGPPGDAVRPTDMGRAWALGSGGSGAPEWVGVLRWMLLPDRRLELGDQVTGSLMRSHTVGIRRQRGVRWT